MELPWPSTMALVARVVDRETSSTGVPAGTADSTSSMAFRMPRARSCRVVRALAEALTPSDGSKRTASV